MKILIIDEPSLGKDAIVGKYLERERGIVIVSPKEAKEILVNPKEKPIKDLITKVKPTAHIKESINYINGKTLPIKNKK